MEGCSPSGFAWLFSVDIVIGLDIDGVIVVLLFRIFG